MTLHQNSQKRIYIENGVYFITTNTYKAHPYFEEDLLCDVLIEEMWHYSKLKEFDIFAYKINPDHIHILMRPYGKHNYSKTIYTVKKNFAYDINCIMGHNKMSSGMLKAGMRIPAFVDTLRIQYRDKFIAKYGTEHEITKFKWQDSFHDHIIRDEDDFRNHVAYIQNQWIKHNLPENKYCFIDEELCGEMLR